MTKPLDIPRRQAHLPAGGRELHRRILRAFVDTGRAPAHDDLRAMAAELGLDVGIAMRGLADSDLVHVDSDGKVVVAYPFSGRPTGIRVRLADGPEIEAMCAIDALGVPAMCGQDAVITATDPISEEPVRVESTGGRWSWQPEGTVVLLASTGEGPTSADRTCPMITFHTTWDSASTHLENQEGVTGKVMSQADAIEISAQLFGPLLAAEQ